MLKVSERTYNFSLRIIKLVGEMPNSPVGWVIGKQVLKSGTSIGANLEEALGGVSGKDYKAKLGIAYKEARETKYWLRLLSDAVIFQKDKLALIIEECDEICALIYTLINKKQK